jgi:hypothetical protein
MVYIGVQCGYLEEDDFVVRAGGVLLINYLVGHLPANCYGGEHEVQD